MILRVYALYRRSLYILVFLMILWGAQIITSAIGLHTGFSKRLILLFLFFVDLDVTVVALPSILTGIILSLQPSRLKLTCSATVAGCILTGDSPIFRTLFMRNIEPRLVADDIRFYPQALVWVGPLVVDSIIFGLTVWRTRMYLLTARKTQSQLVYSIIEPGNNNLKE